MSVAMTVVDQWHVGRKLEVIGTLAFTANYATGGSTCTLASLGIDSSQAPQYVKITGQSGFIYQWVYSTNQTLGKVMIRIATTAGSNLPLAQHSQVAVVNGVKNDTIKVRMVFIDR